MIAMQTLENKVNKCCENCGQSKLIELHTTGLIGQLICVNPKSPLCDFYRDPADYCHWHTNLFIKNCATCKHQLIKKHPGDGYTCEIGGNYTREGCVLWEVKPKKKNKKK